MERSEISRHEIEVLKVLSGNQTSWLSNAEIAARAQGVAPRTVRATTLKLVKAGVLDQAEVFPGHRFRLADRAAQRNRGYFDRLHRAAEVFGVELTV
ncbi:hypothetical protein [Acrocarpospora sp. B8E8]|uniref:hypothetical protein n=1 Tax=Acrocarpospora sp. B8E8 TaxID=3153572 RepID=UPI00325DE061